MKIVACYNCKSDKSTFFASENGYTLVKCNTCGLLYVNPRPNDEEIKQAHKTGRHRGETTFKVTGHYSPQRASKLLKILTQFFEKELQEDYQSWLDIGCGHGELLFALSKVSNGKLIVKGLEPNIDKQKSARQKGLDVSDFDLNQHVDEYDFISLLNVYSHLPDPVEFFESIRKNLKTGGKLFIETGDTANFAPGIHFRPLYLPDHLSFGTEKIVVDILKRSGFEIVGIRKYPMLSSDLYTIAKEIIKLFWPHKRSSIRYLLNQQLYAEADMFILAQRL